MYRIPCLILVSLVLSTVLAGGLPKQKLVNRISARQLKECNIDVCFALDGSVSLKSWQFQLQKNFVSRIVRSLREINTVNVVGVQYGLDNLIVSPLTNDKPFFLNALKNSTFSAVDATFISGGIAYCDRQVSGGPSKNNRIVLLGSGKADFGGDPAIPALPFKDRRGEIFAIEVGSDTDRDVLEDITGNKDNVFRLTRGSDVGPIVIDFLPKLCGVEKSQD